nr:MAG TPA: hypothetical protein [Caudoviricetes sp.]DAR33865.1 MAG TPA: hypothetical protein [Caudoviricetes sp.]DAU03675.1 MAG TPA: hypothetical protein [Caudoviricetes sp.]DAY65305.1 MAG TPA: hypothetical protein [Caudoviricetes sp.]
MHRRSCRSPYSAAAGSAGFSSALALRVFTGFSAAA